MDEDRAGGLDKGHKDLHPELTKLLFNDDMKEVLLNSYYLGFLELFDGFDVNFYH